MRRRRRRRRWRRAQRIWTRKWIPALCAYLLVFVVKQDECVSRNTTRDLFLECKTVETVLGWFASVSGLPLLGWEIHNIEFGFVSHTYLFVGG